MQFKSLLLDLDGTLVDTAPDMVGALDRVLEENGKPKSDYQHASKLVSSGAKALVSYGFGLDISEQEHDALVQRFLEVYKTHVYVDSVVYEGLLEVLELCESTGHRWGVITNKPLHLARDLMDGLGLLKRCSVLLGGDSLPVKKPDPVPLLHSAMLLDLAPSECLYVGDHVRDIQAGRAAGMDTAAALWGYIEESENVDDWNASYQVQRSTNLINLVQDLMDNRHAKT